MAIRQKCIKKRKALLNATLNLVNNNGFHDAPMSKIAKMAEVSPATIYIYFENKQDLINQLYLEVKSEFSTYVFKNYNEKDCIKDSFKQVWMNIADFKLNQIEASNFLSQCDNTPMIDEDSRQAGLKNLQPLINLWERGQQKGVIKLISPYLLYAYTVYPLSFLSNMKQKQTFVLSEKGLEEAFEAAWDSIKL
ncbi:TetR/AcrR family transcriptional regulator [Lutibacter sp.]|uniref:TetR/AcrR family transcriptional regulator n=1 Tax=Lutibacter sp. TaxID=1925666 RepID=UPI0035678328